MTDTTTTDLASFLLARLDEDEAVARAAVDGPDSTWWRHPRRQQLVFGHPSSRVPIADTMSYSVSDHIARHDPARVLAEVAAKRKIVEAHSPYSAVVDPNDWSDGMRRCAACYDHGEHEPAPFPCPTLRALASIYADHPDWRDEWR